VTESEREAMWAMVERQRAGWDYLEEERSARIREANTIEAVQQLDIAFRYTLSLPPRTTSGYMEFYRVLSQLPRR
jgi:hypothetical protein